MAQSLRTTHVKMVSETLQKVICKLEAGENGFKDWLERERSAPPFVWSPPRKVEPASTLPSGTQTQSRTFSESNVDLYEMHFRPRYQLLQGLKIVNHVYIYIMPYSPLRIVPPALLGVP